MAHDAAEGRSVEHARRTVPRIMKPKLEKACRNASTTPLVLYTLDTQVHDMEL